MNFHIHTIRVNSIASLGSLNIGNTIFSANRATEVSAEQLVMKPGELEGEKAGSDGGAWSGESGGPFIATQNTSVKEPGGGRHGE